MGDVASKRTEPGILIFDLESRISFINHAAKTYWGGDLSKIPAEIDAVYKYTREYIDGTNRLKKKYGEFTKIVINNRGGHYYLRSIILHSLEKSRFGIMIMIEKMRDCFVSMTDARETFHLTCRECDVIRCLLKGLTNKEIALSLGIEVNTVKDYIKNIMHKTNITTRTGILSKIISLEGQNP